MCTNYFFIAKNVLFTMAFVFGITSCQKNRSQDDSCARTTAGLAGTYKLTALKYKAGNDSPELDYMLLREVCENDDLIVLEANGTYRYNDLGLVCSPDGSSIGTWSVAGNVIISDGIVSGTIQSFDCHFLTVYSADFIIPGDRITLTIEKQ
ncbi:MAG: hypothetical protein JNJ86_05910 [Chitinophagaceae bacterium]|jgi:hypothetical protein|nr:hypothetical protein [Chitinophagaceae bacterium]